MNKIRIIDLLNKIAKGEEVPKKIKYNDYMWLWCGACQIYETTGEDGKCINLYTSFATEGNLNDEVEVLEEVEDKEYEDITEIAMHVVDENKFAENDELFRNTINALIRNQKYILERLEK